MKSTNNTKKKFPILERSFRWSLYSGTMFCTVWAITALYADSRIGQPDEAWAFVRMWEFRIFSNFLLLQALDLPSYLVNEFTIFATGFVTWFAFGASLGSVIGLFAMMRSRICLQTPTKTVQQAG